MGWTCPSCGVVSDGAYCPACGEERLLPPARGTGRAARRARIAQSAFGRWHARLRASLAALASPPGRLTLDWIEGRRVRYLAPLALFLYVNVAFFLIQSASHVSILAYPLSVHLADDFLGVPSRLFAWLAPPRALDDKAFVAVFDALERVNAKALVVTMVPLFALALAALPLRPGAGTRWRSALAASAHFFAYALIAMSALFPLVALVVTLLTARGIDVHEEAMLGRINLATVTIQAFMFGWYLSRSLRTLTALPQWARLAASVVLVTLLYLLLRVYHLLVFTVTLIAA